MVEMEHQYGSLVRGMLAAHRQMRAKMAANGKSPAAPRAIFTSLRGGMQQLVNALEKRIDPTSVRLSTPVSALEKVPDGWKVQTGNGTEQYDAVILASPAWAAGALLGPVDAELGKQLSAIPYSSSITVNLVYDEAQLGRLPEGFGFLVPVSEGRALLACTFVHRKFLGRTPPGKVVLRAFLGGAKNAALLSETDDTLLALVRRELSEILGDKVLSPHTEPEQRQVTRWPRAMAQYAVGHQQRRELIAAHVASLQGLRLAGNAYDGIGTPDCIRLGRQAARELVAESK
jgi:oxygen-dependent protoporphyrinogen oxidase